MFKKLLNRFSHLANEIKATMRYFYTLSNMAEIKSTDNTNCRQGDREILELSLLLVCEPLQLLGIFFAISTEHLHNQ